MVFRAPGEDEFTESAFKPLAEDTYRVRVEKYEIKSGKDTANRFNPDGNPRVRFFLSPIEIDGDPEALIVDTADEPIPEDKYVLFFFDPDHLGLKPQVAKSRKFLAAALGIPVTQPVEAESLEEMCDMLVDRTLIVDLTVNGKYNNVTDSRPIVKKTRVRKGETGKPPLVEAATEIFNEDDANDPDDY